MTAPLPTRTFALCAILGATLLVLLPWGGETRADTPATPIQHVIVVYQENHSFNEVLGWLCEERHRCEGTDVGTLDDGRSIELTQAPDIVPQVGHSTRAQSLAIDGGRMDGFSRISGCTDATGYACYMQYHPSSIPNLSLLARRFAVSDHTFEMDAIPSWGAHIELVASQLDGFTGDNPQTVPGNPSGSGWGCDSYRDADWQPSPSDPIQQVPACVPAPDGSGPYRPSPVQWIPTIMDRMDDAGLSWRIYAPGPSDDNALPYGWAICPTFAECLQGPQAANVVPPTQVVDDAETGTLPNLSIVIPTAQNSQHNGWSMLTGDNWIGSVVAAAMAGPEWGSTAIFITYDDCGCFYDELAPPPGLGVRVPMVIVSPFARAGYTDTTVASFASLLAFTEEVFGLPPLSERDANAYDYSGAFDFRQPALPILPLARHPIPAAERAWLEAHPPPDDDPT